MVAVASVAALAAAGTPTARPPAVAGQQEEGVQAGACLTPPLGLVAWYPMDEGPPFEDHAGVINAGAWHDPGNPGELAPGKVGSAVLLHGGTNLVDVPDHPELDVGTRDFTIDAWVRFEPDATGLWAIADKRELEPALGYALYILDGQVGFQMADASAPSDDCSADRSQSACTNFESGVILSASAWHFVAVSVTRSGPSFFYIDGQTVPFDASVRHQTLDNAAPLALGRHPSRVGQWQGLLDEIEVFGRALSPAEVEAIFNAGAQGKCHRPTPDPSLHSVKELVNVDVVNACQQAANGFRFTISGMPAPVANTSYLFDRTFEEPCPSNDPAAASPCNPFTTPEAVPTYANDSIVLQWTGTTMLPPGPATPSAHFGYSLLGAEFHTIKAQFLLADAMTLCEACGDSVQWASNITQTIQVSLQNLCGQPMNVNAWVFPVGDPIPLHGLVSTDPVIARHTTPDQMLIKGAFLRPGESRTVSVPREAGPAWEVLVSDWYVADTGALRMRSIHERPFDGGAVTPRETASATLTPSPVHTPSPTDTPMPVDTPTGTPTDAPPPTDTPTPTEPSPPTNTPGTATPPVADHRIFLPLTDAVPQALGARRASRPPSARRHALAPAAPHAADWASRMPLSRPRKSGRIGVRSDDRICKAALSAQPPPQARRVKWPGAASSSRPSRAL